MLNLRDWRRARCPLLGEAMYVWTQGCPRRCPGCANQDALPFVPARAITAETLASACAAGDGLVLSGGEPFAQAAELSRLCQLARGLNPNLRVLTYTGYTFDDLVAAGSPYWDALMRESDALVDGPYVASLACDHPLFGSRNKRLILLGGRVSPDEAARIGPPQLQVGVDAKRRLIVIGTGSADVSVTSVASLLRAKGVRRKARR